MRYASWLLAGALLVGGCSGSAEAGDPAPSSASRAAEPTTPSSAGAPTTAVPKKQPLESSTTTTTAGGTTGTSVAPATASADPLPLELSISPRCAHLSSTVAVTVRTAPGAGVSLIVVYADGNGGESRYVGRADAAGLVRWSFRVPPKAAKGQAQVLSAGREVPGERNNTAVARFSVDEGPDCT